MRKKILLGLCSMLFSIALFAQTTATGKVVDEKGAAIAGASVLEKGTKNGTSTAGDGTYTLKVKSGAMLVISSIGYESMEVAAGSGMNTRLSTDTKALTEVVVTGLGTATSRKKVPIEIATVSSKDAAKSVVGSVEQALVGKIAGAQVQFQSGTPGSSANIVLRTINSLGSEQPLILIDGIQVSDINGIDLGNIDRIEVVKGAAGGMLYGAEGGNGVIQLFTKKGNMSRKPEITLLTQVSSGTVIRNDDKIFAKYHSFETDAQGFITSSGTRLQRDASGAWGNPDFIDLGVNPSAVQNKSYKEQTFDHFSQAYKRAYTTNHTLSVSGGGEKSDYSFTLSRYDENNVLSNKYFRTSIGSNVGFELTKGLTFRNALQVIMTNDDLLSGDPDASIGAVGTNRFALFNSFPYIDFTYKDSLGNTVVSANGGDKTTKNVLSEPEWRSRITERTRIIENANLNYKINKYLEVDYKYGIEFSNMERKNYYKNQQNAPQSGSAYWGQSVKGSINQSYAKYTVQQSLLSLYIRTDFKNDFKINFPLKTITQVSYDYRSQDYKWYFAQGTELPSFPPYNINAAAQKTSGDDYSTVVTYGILFNQTFDYKDLLGVSFGLRSDYGSAFGRGQNAATFGRGTFYFRPTELIKISNIPEWKLRFAYGGGGIQPKPYDLQTTLSVIQLGTSSTLSTQSFVANSGLRLPTVYESEIGTDITIKPNSSKWFSNINIGVSYWIHDAKDQKQIATLPLTTGAAGLLDNLTTIQAKGLDLSLDASVLRLQNFSWDFMGRFGTVTSKVVSISQGRDIVEGIFTLKQGQQLGLFNYQAPLTSINQINPATKTAYISQADAGNYEIVNGMVVDTASKRVQMTATTDQQNAGSYIPKFIASFTNSFNIKKMFVVSFQIDWNYGNKIYNMARQWLYRDRLAADFDKAVTIGGKSGAYVNYYNSLYNSLSPSTWFVESGSFARLRDVSITYNFPSTIKFLKNASFTVSGRNLLTITNYTGLDPEATSTADSQGNLSSEKLVGARGGVDYFAVPNLRSVQASLRVTF